MHVTAGIGSSMMHVSFKRDILNCQVHESEPALRMFTSSEFHFEKIDFKATSLFHLPRIVCMLKFLDFCARPKERTCHYMPRYFVLK